MVLENTSSPAQPVGVPEVIIFAWFLSLLLCTTRYQFSWYIRYLTAVGTFFYLHGPTLKLFDALFYFRYSRLFIHLAAYLHYEPVAVPNLPTYTARDVTVIVPTVDPYGSDFEECIQSIRANNPAQLIIVTAGLGNNKRAVDSVGVDPKTQIKNCKDQNKRQQVCVGLEEVDTKITVLCDDRVFWLPDFLPHILAPFEDEEVGCVGTGKRVRRISKPCFSSSKPYVSLANIWANMWNVLGCCYLEKHNFDLAATNTIDGGVSTISGRTSAHRSAILKDPAFIDGFKNEMLSFGCLGSVGPLNADDDKFITRWMVELGRKISFQYSEQACIETTLGEFPKYLYQCNRWAQTIWRSNPRSLCSLKIWKTQPWCIYAVYLSSLVNFALVTDGLLIYIPWTNLTHPANPRFLGVPLGLWSLYLWILATKMVKTWPHFRRYPSDLFYLPGCILFAWFHSFIKLYAMVTFWDIKWGSRPLDDKNVQGAAPRNDEEQGLLGAGDGVNGGYGTLDEDNVGDVVPNADGNGGDAALAKIVNGGLSEVVNGSNEGGISHE